MIVYVVISSPNYGDCNSETPIKVFLNETDATNYCNEYNTNDDKRLYDYSCVEFEVE